MARERSAALWAQWRERVGRYERGAETAAAFCRREGVSTASLFSWRRRLKVNAAGGEPVTKLVRPQFVPVRLPVGLSSNDGDDRLARVEIELPNGAVVRMTGPSRGLLRTAISAASDASSREASSC